MKSALIILFVGIVSAGQFYSPGQEYVYQYYGRILTGLPQIDNTFAGLALKGQVILQATSQNNYKLQMKNVNFGTFNEKLSGPEPENWRNVQVEAKSPLATQYKQMLESPVEFQVQQGEISAIKISNQEPQWSVNMKKALVATVKIQLPSQQHLVSSQNQVNNNMNPKFWYAQQQQNLMSQNSQNNQYYWSVMEEGIEGKCENTYQVSELPQYMANEYEQGMFQSEICQGKKYFQVLRTRDITKCQDSVIYLSSKGHQNCLVGNCASENTKQSMTRFFACGNSVDDLQITGVINEGEMRQNIVAFNTEQVVTGTKQVLKLESVQQISQQIPEIQAPRTCHDLSYEYQQSDKQSVNSRQEMREILRSYLNQPRTSSFIPDITEKLSTQQVKTQIVEKLQKIARELEDHENFAEKEIPQQLRALKTVISIMKTDDIKQIFQQIQSLGVSQSQQQIIRNLFVDIVRNAGSPSTIVFLKEMIEQEQLNELESYLVIATLSHYVRTPSEEVIHQVYQLIKSQAVQKRFWLKGSANLVFAQLVRNACIQPNKVHYPKELFGEMCSYNNQKITEQYIPYLVQELKNAQTTVEKEMALYAIGQVGHESVLPLLVSYLEGESQESTRQLRKVALWALSDVAQMHRQKLLPVFIAIAQNEAESRTLRIPAIAVIMKLKPETVHLQKLAVSTWFEQDLEVARFIYGTLKELVNLDARSHPEGSYLKDLSKKAKVVLPLAKPIPMILSVNQIYSGYLQNLGIGATMLNSLMHGSDSAEFYHKTEYFLKQVQTTPVEFSVHMSGLKTIASQLMKSVSQNTEIHTQLRELIEKLEIAPRENAKLNLGAWIRLSDDINFAAELNQEDMETLTTKIMSAFKDSGLSVMDKVCGRHPINYQNVFEELPYNAVVPSDLGLPIYVMTQMTYLHSLQGEMQIECSYNRPSVSVNVNTKASFSYTGNVGTYSPFTQEHLMAGINIQRSVNVPGKTHIEVEPVNGQLKIRLGLNEQVNSNSNSIDIFHYHVKPYVARKPSIYADITPAILHSNTKILRSQASPKSYHASFGQQLGVDAYLKVETECDVYDTKTLMDSWANFNYNAFAAQWFFFAETALTAQGRPTARLHKYTVVYNPSRSTTKEAEMKVHLSLASKESNEEPRKITFRRQTPIVQSSYLQSTKIDKSLHECIRKVDSNNAYAINAQVNAKLIGGQQKEYTYSISAGLGQNQLQHKWNLHFENDESAYLLKNLCINGQMSYPTSENSNAQFQYKNKIEFGQSCNQYYVNVEGNSQVSSSQREFSYNSLESKKCVALTHDCESLRERINSESNVETKIHLEKKHAESVEMKLKYCSKKSLQSRAIDQTQFTITTSQELPSPVYQWAKTLNTATKAVLFQYLNEVTEPTIQQNKVQVRLNFDQRLNTITLKVQSPQDNVVFRNIRVPASMQNVLPLVAGQNPIEHTYKALYGKAYYPKCVVGQGYVQTFDKKTYSYQVDECDHLITSDCSQNHQHAVLAKEVNGLKHVTIYQGQAQIELRPAQAYSNQVDNWKLSVNGQQVQLRKNEKITLKSSSALEQITAYWTNDNTVVINTPQVRLVHQGKTVTLEVNNTPNGSQCGLCGDYNMDKRTDVLSSKGCIMSSVKLAAHTYRSKSEQCRPISEKTLSQIRTEEERCVKFETKETKVKSVFNSELHDSRSIKKHSYIYKDDKICISQIPLVQCSINSMPREMRKKTVNFVCLPEGRVAKLYAERIERGEILQELKHQPVAFKAEMDQPVSCKPRQV